MRKLPLILALLLGAIAPAAAHGSTYFVATDGRDSNSGTIDAPWQTLRFAVAQLVAGDTLQIRGGTYAGAENLIDSYYGTVRGGTSWENPITIGAYAPDGAVPGGSVGPAPNVEVVTLQPGDTQTAITLLSPSQQYIIFQDLVIDGSNQVTDNRGNLIYGSGGMHHNRFIRLDVKNSVNFGIGLINGTGNSPFNEIINCKIHNNGTAGGNITQGHGIYDNTSDNVIEGNEIYDNQGYGIHIYNNSGPLEASRNIIRNNSIHNNGRHGGSAYGIVVAWGDRNVIEDNTIFGNPGGILVYTNSSNAIVRNNNILDNRPLEGILILYATGSAVTGNVILDNGAALVDWDHSSAISNNLTRRP